MKIYLIRSRQTLNVNYIYIYIYADRNHIADDHFADNFFTFKNFNFEKVKSFESTFDGENKYTYVHIDYRRKGEGKDIFVDTILVEFV